MAPKGFLNRRKHPSVRGEVKTFSIGRAGTKFTVHKALLCHYSEYFRAALTGDFKEATQDVITLDDVYASVFAQFVDWLYAQHLRLPEDLPIKEAGEMVGTRPYAHGVCGKHLVFLCESCSPHHLRYTELLNLYIFADAYDIPYLRQDCLWEIHQLSFDNKCVPSAFLIRYAYKRLPESSKLLQYLIKLFIN